MTFPEQGDGSPIPVSATSSPAAELDEGEMAERAIGEALSQLEGLRELPVAEHVERFETVHTALTDALNKAENFLSGTHSNGS